MRNEKHPDRLEPIQGANTLGEQDKDSDYLSNIQILGESFEGEKLIDLINNKKRYIKTIDNPTHGRMLQKEILFLENDILPIVLRSTTLLYSELSTFFERKVKKAIDAECNAIIAIMELSPSTDDTIRIGTVNTHSNPVEGIDLIINGNGRKIEEVML